MFAADPGSAPSPPASTDNQNETATASAAASAPTGSAGLTPFLNRAGAVGVAEPPTVDGDGDALTAVQLAALASKTLHGGADQASDALVARYNTFRIRFLCREQVSLLFWAALRRSY
jgi:hypothetical protein